MADCCHHGQVPLTLSIREGAPAYAEWLSKPFQDHPGFTSQWWIGEAKGPLVFCSFAEDTLGEVARAQLRPHSAVGVAYPAWSRPLAGSTEIDLLEVRVDLQERGIGRAAVDLLIAGFPAPAVALSLDSRSDGFWRSIGWTPYEHEDAAEYRTDGPRPSLMFVSED